MKDIIIIKLKSEGGVHIGKRHYTPNRFVSHVVCDG